VGTNPLRRNFGTGTTDGATLCCPTMFRALAIFTSLFVFTSVASAHGGVPQSQAVLFDPDDPDHILVAATFGLLETSDGGATWQWTCIQSIPSGRLGFADPTVVGPGGTVFLAHRDGLHRSDSRGCGWTTTPAALDGSFVADVAIETATGAVLALQSDVSVDNRIQRSADGETFTPLAGTIPAPFLPERVRSAPSDPERLYVSGATLAMGGMPAMPAVYVSGDGGDTWTPHPFTFEENELDLLLLAVDPTDPDRVFAWVKGELTDRLVVSDDGGATFDDIDTLAAAPVPNGRPFGFALASDGTIFYGNSEQGLFRTTDGTTLELLDRNLDVACLVIRDDLLHVCGNGRADADGFSVATSPVSDPTSFTPLLTFDRITGVISCAPPSDVTTTCEEWWDDLLRDTGRPVPDGGIADAAVDAGEDGGIPDSGALDSSAPPDASGDVGAEAPPPDPGADGCGCRVARSNEEGGGAGFLALLTLLAVCSRRVRSRRG
jgi:hypothetical protein